MPTYEWKCPDCEETSSENMTIALYEFLRDFPLICDCGGKKQRVFFPTGVQFKGGGWGSS